MRHHENVHASAHYCMAAAIREIGQALGLKDGFVDDARRAATPYVVDAVGLNGEDLPYHEYLTQLREREYWCVQHCPRDHEIEPLRERGRLVGRRYRFAREYDATLFKLFFG
ncbi:hypothetical protein [Microvirga sp. CF3016]|uniref:hypothetical protein n=1 Tax=Microvirga sp. CF3016 TaxID=3110181 RepID=UPI002E78E999|nr:hypothetical protein [Microvirga sp. CF3016]MEE1614040.1 hypothetical protein [Microvirga sp. CF3016]